MGKSREISNMSQICNLLHICLIKAINTAMTERAGENWFYAFKEYDKNQPKPVLDKEQTSVNRMDLQSCLKFLRFREDYSKIVFEYYGYNFFDKTEDAKKAQMLLNQLLDNLIHNVRNQMYAHASATMIESGKDDSLRSSVYGPQAGINDMLRLCEFFKAVKDTENVSYYDRMSELSRPVSGYSIATAIRVEEISVSVGTFAEVCNNIGIPVRTADRGEMIFESDNYEGDIARIKLEIGRSQPKKKSKLPLIILVTVLALLLAGAVFALASLLTKDNERAPEETTTNNASVETTSAEDSTAMKDTTASDTTAADTTAADTIEEIKEPTGEGSYGSIVFKVAKISGNRVVLSYENEDRAYSLGWVDSSLFTITTVSGKTVSSNTALSMKDRKINPYSSGEIEFYFEDDIEEEVESISIIGVYELFQGGLPDPSANPATIKIKVSYGN